MFFRIFNQRTALTHRLSVYLLFFGTLALVGCGGNANRSSSGLDQSLVNNPPPNPFPSPSYSPPPPGGGFTPSYSFSYSIAGYSGTYTSASPVQTDNVLKVRVTAGPGGPLSDPNYSNFVANYGCVQYQVTVSGIKRSTGILSVSPTGGMCPGTYAGQWQQAPHSAIIDFYDVLSPGHGPISITVSEPTYDFYCAYWYSYGWQYSPYNNWCPLKSVYRSHTVTGTLDVQVNGF